VRLDSRQALLGFLVALVTGLGAGCGSDGPGPPAPKPIATNTAARTPSRAATDTWMPAVKGPRAVVWAVGDGADGGIKAGLVAQLIETDKPDRFLYLGDVYERGTADEFAQNFNIVYEDLLSVIAPTPGNHEWPTHQHGYDAYWRQVRGKRPPPYYAFDVAGWHILSLNSEVEHDEGSVQLRWLRSQLRAPGTCRIAYWHRPRFSAGLHNNQPDMAPVWDALRDHATIVLTGHDHDMQRFEPRDGITEFVSGAGGHSLYPVLPGRPEVKFANDRDYGALRLQLRRGSARYAFVAADGRVLDSGSLRCRPS
jgi:hypothetical protein